MADNSDRYDNEGSGGGGFMMGLLTGTVLGAGLGMLLAPKAGAELRGAIGEQAKTWGNVANEQYKKASEAAGTWTEQGRDLVNKAREAVTRGVDEARSYSSGPGGTDYSSGPSGPSGSSSSGSSFGNGSTTGSKTGSSFGTTSGSGGDFGRS
jgi:gas vesicle protein